MRGGWIMVKIKLSYTNESDLAKIMDRLKGLKIISKSKPYQKKDKKDMYIEVE